MDFLMEECDSARPECVAAPTIQKASFPVDFYSFLFHKVTDQLVLRASRHLLAVAGPLADPRSTESNCHAEAA